MAVIAGLYARNADLTGQLSNPPEYLIEVLGLSVAGRGS
jgi:hypothetical protein